MHRKKLLSVSAISNAERSVQQKCENAKISTFARFFLLYTTYRWGIHNFLPQELVLSRRLVEQSPIHLYVPRVRVAGADNGRDYPQDQVRIVRGIRIIVCKSKFHVGTTKIK